MTSDHPSKLKNDAYRPPQLPNGRLVNTSVDFTDNHVNEDLHRAFQDSEISYNDEYDTFFASSETPVDEKALFDSQQALSDALQQYERDAEPKFKTGLDLKETHTWEEVMNKVDTARDEYNGVGKEGYLNSIHDGLRNFHTAAPAIEAWLKLLPSNSIYGSVLCGGITMILEAAVRIGKLREDTYEALDQIPLRVERAQTFMRLYAGTKMNKQAADLYSAIIDALQHIVAWYKRKAGMKYMSSFGRNTNYAATLRLKMKNVEDASQAMENRAGLNQHIRIQDIRHVTLQTKNQLSSVEAELKDLAVEARNHLYKVFRDTEAWQEAVQSWVASQQANVPKRKWSILRTSDIHALDGESSDKDSLLSLLGHNANKLSLDVKNALQQIFSFSLVDQDRAVAIIQHPTLEEWILQSDFGPLLVHANSRWHGAISPASVASAMIVHIFSSTIITGTVPIITLYWFCGPHIDRANDPVAGLMRSLICQLLVLGPFDSGFRQAKSFDSTDLATLFRLFKRLLLQLPESTVVVCVIDGISWYEDSDLWGDTRTVIRKLVRLTREEVPILKLLMTSPKRTTRLNSEPRIEKHVTVIEIREHVDGAKQGFNHRAMIMSTKEKVRRFSETLPTQDD